ncbi:prepilin-type N-terminal cleavage/methylation domain-containing protein [Candidatus Peregrinibacteria bacterium]|nr:prepilin-type N-terminal cleavage/methylation domain-containing protein [Candidatus Peregrinibacteria bacterium]
MNKGTKAFTIIEILIAIAVILILAAAALSGSGGIIRSMRFNNAFNKLVFMTQRARSLAIAKKNADIEKYMVVISLAPSIPQFPKNTAALILYKYDAPKPETIEVLTLQQDSQLYLKTKKANDLECNDIAVVIFKNGASEPVLACGGPSVISNPSSSEVTNILKIFLTEQDASGNAVREKSFALYNTSGIPQIE